MLCRVVVSLRRNFTFEPQLMTVHLDTSTSRAMYSPPQHLNYAGNTVTFKRGRLAATWLPKSRGLGMHLLADLMPR